jgi:hypothetical protein
MFAKLRLAQNRWQLDKRADQSGDQVQIIRLIRDCTIAKGADDGAITHIEDTRHLVAILFNHADAMLAKRTLQPSFPDSGDKQMGENVFAFESENRMKVERGIRIADSLDVGEVIVVEVGLGSLR